jgi:peptidoglycan/xylan/chitin deacetylase (PgdA/CDA1 family)
MYTKPRMTNRLENLTRKVARFVPPTLLRPMGRPAVIFFHGVERHIDDPRVQRGHYGSEAFYAIAKSLKKYFQVLPLSAIDDVLKRPERHIRSVFLTSDDGLASTFTVAADILEDLRLPWALFVSTHHIGTGDRLPTFLARLFFYYAPRGRYEIPHFDLPIELGDDVQRAALAETFIDRLKSLGAARARQSLDAMLAVLPPRLPELLERFKSESFLTWEQVSALKRRGVEIGSHGHFHWPMHRRQSPDYLRMQARISRAAIEEKIGPCRFFAYPFGGATDISPEAWQTVRDAGYDYAFTTMTGSVDASCNPFLLPRNFVWSSDTRLGSLIPLVHVGNARLAGSQRQIAT